MSPCFPIPVGFWYAKYLTVFFAQDYVKLCNHERDNP